MKKYLGFVIAVALFATPSFAQKVTIHYAKDFDFDNIRTFSYKNTEPSNSRDAEVDAHVREKMIAALESDGLQQVDEGGDIVVTYHVTTPENTNYDTEDFGYGGTAAGWDPWGVGGVGVPETTPSMNFVAGTMLIDAYVADSGLMVWRATSEIEVKDTTKAKIKKVDKTFKKINKKWAKILAGEGK